jgi:hypothetical protein
MALAWGRRDPGRLGNQGDEAWRWQPLNNASFSRTTSPVKRVLIMDDPAPEGKRKINAALWFSVSCVDRVQRPYAFFRKKPDTVHR